MHVAWADKIGMKETLLSLAISAVTMAHLSTATAASWKSDGPRVSPPYAPPQDGCPKAAGWPARKIYRNDACNLCQEVTGPRNVPMHFYFGLNIAVCGTRHYHVPYHVNIVRITLIDLAHYNPIFNELASSGVGQKCRHVCAPYRT